MLHKIYFTLVCFFCSSGALLSDDGRGFVLVDKVCVSVDNERPITLREISRKAETLGIDRRTAQLKLIDERGLMVAAKKLLKFNFARIKEARNNHIRKIIESNKITPAIFKNKLKDHYHITLEQYEYDTDVQILKSQYEAPLADSIDISPREIEIEMAKRGGTPADFVVMFISIAPKKGVEIGGLRRQFHRAKMIKQEILGLKDLSELQKKYAGQSDVSIVGPLAYKEDSLDEQYELQLKKNPGSKITEPFKDGGAVTMILKEKVLQPDNQKTALEKVRNDIYKGKAKQRQDADVKNALADLSVVINCEY